MELFQQLQKINWNDDLEESSIATVVKDIHTKISKIHMQMETEFERRLNIERRTVMEERREWEVERAHLKRAYEEITEKKDGLLLEIQEAQQIIVQHQAMFETLQVKNVEMEASVTRGGKSPGELCKLIL